MSEFIYKLNAFEIALQQDCPFDHNYAGKRLCVIAHVDDAEARIGYLESQLAAATQRADGLEKDAARWEYVKPVLSGDDTPLANQRTLWIAAALMRQETIEQAVDSGIAAIDAAMKEVKGG